MRVQTQWAERSRTVFFRCAVSDATTSARSPKRRQVLAMNVAGVSPLQAPLRHAVAPNRASRCRNRAVVTVRAGWFDNFGASTDNKRDAEFRRQQARAQARNGAAVSVGATPVSISRPLLTAFPPALLGGSVRPPDRQEERRGGEAESRTCCDPRSPQPPPPQADSWPPSRRWPAT